MVSTSCASGRLHHRFRSQHGGSVGALPPRRHARSEGNPAINNYAAGDGRRFWIVGLEVNGIGRHWRAPSVHPEWLVDERLSTPGARARMRGSCRRTRSHLRDEAAGRMVEVFAPRMTSSGHRSTPSMTCWPIHNWSRPAALVVVPDGSVRHDVISRARLTHGTPWAPRSLATKLGEHTREVLASLGKRYRDRRVAHGRRRHPIERRD